MRRLAVLASSGQPQAAKTPLPRSAAERTAGFGWVPLLAKVERLSIELTRACAKGCSFCYNGSSPRGATEWRVDEVLALAEDCIRHGLESISFGGGEPLQYSGLFQLLERLEGQCFRSLTTNGLLLDRRLQRLVAARPDKVHVSLHFPDDGEEVRRVSRQVRMLGDHGIRSGVNLLVCRSKLEEARAARQQLEAAGITPSQILLLPMRGQETPTAQEIIWVAGKKHFQSVTCLSACAASPRFVALGWDRRVGWCSYTTSRRPLGELSHRGVVAALRGLELRTCGPSPARG